MEQIINDKVKEIISNLKYKRWHFHFHGDFRGWLFPDEIDLQFQMILSTFKRNGDKFETICIISSDYFPKIEDALKSLEKNSKKYYRKMPRKNKVQETQTTFGEIS